MRESMPTPVLLVLVFCTLWAAPGFPHSASLSIFLPIEIKAQNLPGRYLDWGLDHLQWLVGRVDWEQGGI